MESESRLLCVPQPEAAKNSVQSRSWTAWPCIFAVTFGFFCALLFKLGNVSFPAPKLETLSRHQKWQQTFNYSEAVETWSLENYDCRSSLDLGLVVKPLQKGIAVDDVTFKACDNGIPLHWPNTASKLSSLRLFKAWDRSWPEELRRRAWSDFRELVHLRNVSVLVGTQVTCNEKEDDRDWDLVLELLQFLGRKHVMGVAVGNEMELVQFKQKTDHISAACIHRIWGGGYLARKVLERAQNLAFLPGFQDLPLTSVLGGYILTDHPFVDTPGARVLTFLKNVTQLLGKRYVFSLNSYPYFDPQNHLDVPTATGQPASSCTASLSQALCMEEGCLLPAVSLAMRKRMAKITRVDHQLWITETGWSFPMASSLNGANPVMAQCVAWSSETSFQTYYNNIMKWDLSVGLTHRGPDHLFFFSLRDASNFGMGEHFGLMEDCTSARCKLK